MSYPSSNHLPAGWVNTTLGQVAILNPRSLENPPNDDDPVSFVPMASVEEESGRLDSSRVRPWREIKKGYTPFQEGDVLFAKITPCMENGKYAIANGLFSGRGAGSTEFHVLRPCGGVQAEFILYYLFQDSVRREARLKMKGAAGQLRVPPEFLQELVFPLPPEPEQRRIGAEIEKQFTRLDAAVAALKRVQANLKRYRAAVLKAACEGRLVPAEAELARREGRSYEPASELLKRILAERRARWEADQLACMTAANKRASNNPNKRKYKEPESPDSSSLAPLPEGWVWTNLGQLKLFSIYGPRFSSDDYSDEGTVVLRTTDISEAGKVDLCSAPKLQLSTADFEKYRLIPGDLVFTRTGATIGKTAIFNDEVRAIPGAYLIHFRLVTLATTAWYIYRFFQSVRGQSYLLAGRLGIGQPNLNAPTIEAIPLPLPPIAEQQRIHGAIDAQLAVAEKEMQQISESCRRADRLRQSILKRAFEGKLVPQDPSDEPASALLERIRGTAIPGCALVFGPLTSLDGVILP